MTKSIYDLDDEEVAIVGQCLVAAVDGPFFPDWEFEILMGRSRDEVRLVAAEWRAGTLREEHVETLIAVLNNMIGYPHGKESAWRSYVTATPAKVSSVLDKIRARERPGA